MIIAPTQVLSDGRMIVTSPYGERTLNGQKQFHPGIDLRNVDPITGFIYSVIAPEDIVIMRVGIGQIYGENFIVAYALNSMLTLKFMHTTSYVRMGDKLKQGAQLGLSDNSGNVPIHLHVEVWSGDEQVRYDPITKYFQPNHVSWVQL